MATTERSLPAPALTTAGHPSPELEAASARVHQRVMIAVFAGYLLFATGLALLRGGTIMTPDRIAVLLLFGAVLLGQGKAFVRDWGPFVLLLFGYEMMRGVADNMANLGRMTREDHGNIQLGWLIDVDKALWLGHVPSVWLQDRLYVPGTVHWYDVVAAVVYMLHFVLPLAFGFALWLRSREAFRRFTLTLLVMSYGAFVFFLLLPTAPPWMAQEWGYLPNLDRPSQQAYQLFLPQHFQSFDTFKLWSAASPNPVAAFPSLHAAFPWLVMLFAVRAFGRKGLLLLPYNVALWFSIVYLSQHWVVDAIAGVLWATAVYLAVDWAWRRFVLRRSSAVIRAIPNM